MFNTSAIQADAASNGFMECSGTDLVAEVAVRYGMYYIKWRALMARYAANWQARAMPLAAKLKRGNYYSGQTFTAPDQPQSGR
jgi:hypothetical protein